jgi:hypothetical protein
VVTVQAIKSVSLVVRRPDGSVYFAQQLKPGEAYRAPSAGNFSLDIAAWQDVRIYAAGQLHAPLSAQLTPVGKLTPPPAPAPAPGATAGAASATAPAG